MKKILLIEDNNDIRENTAKILELSNYDVIVAENEKIGVEKAIEFAPDLILCDIMMPGLDGYGVLHAVHKNEAIKNTPFIFLTAKIERADFRKGMELGADDYITKPFEGIELLNAVDSRLKKIDLLKKELAPGLEELQNPMETLIVPYTIMKKEIIEKIFKALDILPTDIAAEISDFIDFKLKKFQDSTQGTKVCNPALYYEILKIDKMQENGIAEHSTESQLTDAKKILLVEDLKTVIFGMIRDADGLEIIKKSEYISQKLNLNYTYLAHIFSEVLGITLEHYFINQKIELVKELLLKGQLNLSEISYKLNYSSVAHLSNQFKKVTGITPSLYKSQSHSHLRKVM